MSEKLFAQKMKKKTRTFVMWLRTSMVNALQIFNAKETEDAQMRDAQETQGVMMLIKNVSLMKTTMS